MDQRNEGDTAVLRALETQSSRRSWVLRLETARDARAAMFHGQAPRDPRVLLLPLLVRRTITARHADKDPEKHSLHRFPVLSHVDERELDEEMGWIGR